MVSRILGHSKASITLDIYGHLIHDLREEAARVMDEAITPIPVDFSNGELEKPADLPKSTPISDTIRMAS